ncbi:hypothetical protein [Cohnella lupini]|uniref:Uncharacterized protein n=1 Tax=Cohnella lupini TaxID=1294267 RepID=A0A3D9IYJ1_9BACL|nr:hypothetical protein [Cohnella lupini]RED66146.1 hypothetical protein DFP95_101644 [Cohnella lupini]
MQLFIFIMGIIVLVFGIFFGFASGNLTLLLAGFVAGPLLLGIAKIIQILEGLDHKLLRIPYSLDQVWKVIKSSTIYEMESKDFEVHPNVKGNTQFPLVLLDDEYYLKARVFKKYFKEEENEYLFELPKQEPITLQKSYSYYPGVELFDFRDHLYVLLKKINVYPNIEGNKVTLEYFKDERYVS